MSDKLEPPMSSTTDQIVTPPDRFLEEIGEEVKTRTPKSSPKRLQKRASKRYWTVHFYNFTDALSKLTGLTVANCNPTTEHNPPLHSKESGQ